jgi:thiol-disulfide isomerase/thioredoxin
MKKILITLLVLGLVGCNKPPAKPAAVEAGLDNAAVAQNSSAAVPVKAWSGNASDFAFTTFDGKSLKLSSYAGKPLVLNFWADWWPPCRAEFPHFQSVYESHRGQFELVAITAPNSTDPEGFVKQNGYTFTFGKAAPQAFEQYKVEGIPVTVFIDRSGNVVDKVVGGIATTEDFDAYVAKIL